MITSCLYQFYNKAWCYSRTVIACTKFWISLRLNGTGWHPAPFNPRQNHLAEHFGASTSFQFLRRLKSLNERGRRHNINEVFHIMVLWFWVSFTSRDEKDWQHKFLRTLCHILIKRISVLSRFIFLGTNQLMGGGYGGVKPPPKGLIKAKFTYLLHFFSFLDQTCQIDYGC